MHLLNKLSLSHRLGSSTTSDKRRLAAPRRYILRGAPLGTTRQRQRQHHRGSFGRQHYQAFRCCGAGNSVVGGASAQGTGSKHDAGISNSRPRCSDSTDRSYSAGKTSSRVPASCGGGSKEHGDRPTHEEKQLYSRKNPRLMECNSRLRARRHLQSSRLRENICEVYSAGIASGRAPRGSLSALQATRHLHGSRDSSNPSPREQGVNRAKEKCATCAPPIIAVYAWYPLEGVQSNQIRGYENGYHSNRMNQSGRATWPSGSVIGCSILSSTGIESRPIPANQTRHIVTQAGDSSSSLQPQNAGKSRLLSVRSDCDQPQRHKYPLVFSLLHYIFITGCGSILSVCRLK